MSCLLSSRQDASAAVGSSRDLALVVLSSISGSRTSFVGRVFCGVRIDAR